jgi:hypothetical protein
VGVGCQWDDVVSYEGGGEGLSGILFDEMEMGIVEIFAKACGGFLLTAPQGIDGDVGSLLVIVHQGIDETGADQSCGTCQEKRLAPEAIETVRPEYMFQIFLV